MSTAETITGATAGPALGETKQVPLSRLVQVELRKLVDTRSGRWLLIAIAALTATIVTIYLFAAEPEELTFSDFVNVTATPQAILLPILGILTVTSEWGQRTGLVTFTLEPHRSRIVVAKFIAVLVMGTAVIIMALGLAALGNVLGAALQDGDGSWAFGAAGVRDIFVLQLVGVVQGLAFGMLIMNSAGAIVTYFALPTVLGILNGTVTWFQDHGIWIDINRTSEPLFNHEMDGEAWAQLSVSVLVWVVLPLVLGWFRLLHRELKSA